MILLRAHLPLECFLVCCTRTQHREAGSILIVARRSPRCALRPWREVSAARGGLLCSQLAWTRACDCSFHTAEEMLVRLSLTCYPSSSAPAVQFYSNMDRGHSHTNRKLRQHNWEACRQNDDEQAAALEHVSMVHSLLGLRHQRRRRRWATQVHDLQYEMRVKGNYRVYNKATGY